MKSFNDLVREVEGQVQEIFPWDLEEHITAGREPLIVDVREPYEFDTMHIPDSINVPRGVLETAAEWDYEETEPELVEARDRYVVVACRSGNRSIFAARVLAEMGFGNVVSLKTGLRGWNEYEQPLVDEGGDPVTVEEGDAYFATKLMPDQRRPRE
ncbi:MAG: rhodanese-like domain-containing protein [Gammaproteobacteria bacterium]|nr:rhodanese-like domain-containing protein [Gammaproteobacteria bacterium]